MSVTRETAGLQAGTQEDYKPTATKLKLSKVEVSFFG